MIQTALLWGVLAVLLGVVERIAPEDGSRTRVDTTARTTDAGWMLVHLALVPLLGALLAEVAAAGEHSPLHGHLGHTPWGLQLGLVAMIAEVAAYWVHRLQHTVPVLWRIHSVHHSTESLRWWSTVRSHPLDVAMSNAVPMLLVGATGAAPSVTAAYLAVVLVATVFAHADVHVPAGWPHWVVVTPRFHRTHHERDGEHTNFSRALPWCDVAFGTARSGVGRGAFGSADGAPRRGLWAQLAWGVGIATPTGTDGRDHRVIATPITSEAMFAPALVDHAAVDET